MTSALHEPEGRGGLHRSHSLSHSAKVPISFYPAHTFIMQSINPSRRSNLRDFFCDIDRYLTLSLNRNIRMNMKARPGDAAGGIGAIEYCGAAWRN